MEDDPGSVTTDMENAWTLLSDQMDQLRQQLDIEEGIPLKSDPGMW